MSSEEIPSKVMKMEKEKSSFISPWVWSIKGNCCS